MKSRKRSRSEKPLKIKDIRGYGLYPLSEDERLFCQLVYVLGYTAARSYQIAFCSKANMNSAAVAACRLLQQEDIQDYIQSIRLNICRIEYNENVVKF